MLPNDGRGICPIKPDTGPLIMEKENIGNSCKTLQNIWLNICFYVFSQFFKMFPYNKLCRTPVGIFANHISTYLQQKQARNKG